MATLHAFDTLAYTKALVDRGYERDKAEALAEAQREFFVKDLASEDFVRAELGKVKTKLQAKIDKVRAEIDKAVTRLDHKIDTGNEKIRHEITASEKRMTMTIGKMLAFAVGVILAAPPLIEAFLQRLERF